VIRQLNINWGAEKKETQQPKTQKRSVSRLHLNTLEYEIIANLVAQQYLNGTNVKFDALLSIPLTERIPGLIEAYGKKTMHKLLVMILTEFSKSLPLVKAKKLTDTKISVAACEIMLTAYEDNLSLEDIILFLQKVKAGNYGIVKNMSHTSILFNMLEKYRQARHLALLKLEEAKHKVYKAEGDTTTTNGQPKQLDQLLQQAFLLDISNRA
jgi:hypothetical protein